MLGSIFGAILTYESWPIPRLECLLPGHFAKKSSDFTEINPQSNLLSQKILQKTLNFFRNQPTVQRPLSVLFAKKTPNFSEIQPAIQAFLGWLATRSVGLSGPNSAQSWFALSIILFQLRINLLKL